MGLVPETIVRDDGPYGAGSYQRFVAADFTEHYFTLLEDRRTTTRCVPSPSFDLVANNADRKSGHCLLADDGHIWGIDHGLCFAVPPKLRTVMWDFAGEAITDVCSPTSPVSRATRRRRAGRTAASGRGAATLARAAAVVRGGRFPNPDPDRRPYPWPMV